MKNQFGNFFKEKKVLITGHTGFIGSWLSIWLNELGANIIGYALPPYTKKDNFAVTNLQEKILSIIGDIRNFDKLSNVFKENQPEIVFHLAAQPIVRKSYDIPKETYDVNVGGTVNIIEAFRRNNSCKVLINITSDKCYENKERIWGYREIDRLGGHDPYSSSKACSELVTSAYIQSFFNSNSSQNKKRISSVRSGNMIGGGDWQVDRLIPDCMRSIANNQKIILRNPNAIRPWQHVLEPIRGYLTLAMNLWEDKKEFTGAWNFGPGNNSIFSVQDVVKKIIQILGKGSYKSLLPHESSDLHETKILQLDSSKSYRYLGWKTVLNFEEMIKYTCDWYMEENIDYAFDVRQIKSYFEKCKH